MAISLRRSRRPDSLPAAVESLVDDIGVPVPNNAVRIVLNNRGRRVTAEQLGSLAGKEQDAFRSLPGAPLRLSFAIAPDGSAIAPRLWAIGTWRLARRIQTADVVDLWRARWADYFCLELAERPPQPGADLATLTLATVARLGFGQDFDVPRSREEWHALRGRVLTLWPIHSKDGLTSEQLAAEKELIADHTPGTVLYFGRRPPTAQEHDR